MCELNDLSWPGHLSGLGLSCFGEPGRNSTTKKENMVRLKGMCLPFSGQAL